MPASSEGKGSILTSVGWQSGVIPYGMRVSGSGEAKLMLTAIRCLFYFTHGHDIYPLHRTSIASRGKKRLRLFTFVTAVSRLTSRSRISYLHAIVAARLSL